MSLSSKPSKRKKFLSWLAGTAAFALIASTFVVTQGIQQATAAGDAPGVEVPAEVQPYVAGEDLTLDFVFTGITDRYNLSYGLVIDKDVEYVSGSTSLAEPQIYGPGTILTPDIATGTEPDTCEALGLLPALNGCEVGPDDQYLVFQNLADLPHNATLNESITLRPKAATFPVGSTFEYQLNAYTSGNPRYLPVFPGSTGVNTPEAASLTSDARPISDEITVSAARIEKTEPSPENELLRGVHENVTTYTLRVHHTGEGDIANAEVVDFIPAGLEYLGLGVIDNTENANGTRDDGREYEGASDLTADALTGAWHSAGERVETVIPNAEEVTKYGLDAGKVYTKVTWNLGILSATADARDELTGVEQEWVDEVTGVVTAEGTPGVFEIQYLAAVPLFENTMDFDGVGGQPEAESGKQIANLDNNRGASTRHGSETTTDRAAAANEYRNVAVIRGSYASQDVADFHHDEEEIHAVDVHILKSVVDTGGPTGAGAGSFQQGRLTRYQMQLKTSEYVAATLGDPNNTGQPDNDVLRLVDDMADGLCPAFGPSTRVWEDKTHPNLVLGSYNNGTVTETNVDPVDWNTMLENAGVDPICQWGTPAGEEPDDFDQENELSGALLSGIAFDPEHGNFMLEFALDPLDALNDANQEHTVQYSVHQNSRYIQRLDEDGSIVSDGVTTSMDRFLNEVEINARTTPIDILEGVVSAGSQGTDAAAPDTAYSGEWNAWDDSHATVEAGDTRLFKHVLHRDAGVPERDQIAQQSESAWVKSPANNKPFAVGDQVWYRVVITPPAAADVRNPVFTDFLPLGVEFDETKNSDDRFENVWIQPGTGAESLPGIGECRPETTADWLDTFVPVDGIEVEGQALTFTLGSTECVEGNEIDRFMPFEASLEIYLKVTVTDPSAFAAVDIAQNLAKFRHSNVHGEVFALSSQAEIAQDMSVRLVKGIETNTNDDSTSSDNAVNSNVDGEEVLQGNEVTFRLDVTAPALTTAGYVIYDALPEGIRAADLGADDGGIVSSTAQLWEGNVDGVSVNHTARVYDNWNDPALNGEVSGTYTGQSIVVWEINGDVPGSTIAGPPETTPVERGVSLSYTVTVPTPDGSNPALLNQAFTNTASIVEYSVVGNGGSTTSLFPEPIGNEVPTGGSTLDKAGQTAEPVGVRQITADGYAVPADFVTDISDVSLPNADMSKVVIRSEIQHTDTDIVDADNEVDEIVQGEWVTFELKATIPAHTSVPAGATLEDRGYFTLGNVNGTQVNYTVDAASTKQTTPPDADVTVDEATGKLTFNERYDAGEEDRDFIVELRVRIDDAAVGTLTHGNVLHNVATFDPQVGPELSDSDTVTYIDPQPTITKTNDAPESVAIGTEVTYRLEVGNTADRPLSYDNVVTDEVPEGLEVQEGSFFVNEVEATHVVQELPHTDPGTAGSIVVEQGVLDGEGGFITWYPNSFPALATISEATPVTLTYVAEISESAGAGRTYINTAEVGGYTLPSSLPNSETRRGSGNASDTSDVNATTADIQKKVRLAPEGSANPSFEDAVDAPIGDRVQYEVFVTLNGDINYYKPQITDVLPAGVVLDTNAPITIEEVTGVGSTDTVNGSQILTWDLQSDGSTHTWSFVNSDEQPADITSMPADRFLRLTYFGDIRDSSDQRPNTLTNTVDFSWFPSALEQNDPEQREHTDVDHAVVNVLNPELQIGKTVDTVKSTTVNPDESFTYRLVVDQTVAGNTPAHNIVIADEVPEGVIVTESSVTPVPTEFDEALAEGKGGWITWEIQGPLNHQAAEGDAVDKFIELTYDASFIDSEGLSAQNYLNTAYVTNFASFDENGREYPHPVEGDGPKISSTADVTPIFPNVVLEKTVAEADRAQGEDYGLATGSEDDDNVWNGDEFTWVLKATNTGEGTAQTIDITDTLPENWSFVETTSVSIGGQAADLSDYPETVDRDGPETITWSFGTENGAFALPGTEGGTPTADREIIITFTAAPDTLALDTPGTGVGTGDITDLAAHVNTMSANTTDTDNNSHNAGNTSYTGEDDTAVAYIAEVDLILEKTASGGVVDQGGDDAANLYGLPAGTWVSGQGPIADRYEQPQWQLIITNDGPDPATGEFKIVDAPTLPEGVEMDTGEWSAHFFANDASDGVPLNLRGTGTEEDPLFIDADTHELTIDGSSSIVVTVPVSIEDDVQASGSELSNTATVSGERFERTSNTPNNTSTAEKELQQRADLSLLKTLSTVEPNAGESITWVLTPRNEGPSVSRSSADSPITITDVVPEGVHGVTGDGAAGVWSVAYTDEGGDPVDPGTEGVGPGTVITWTYQKSVFEVGPEDPVRVHGTIDADWTSNDGPILNVALIHPGETDDPDYVEDPDHEDQNNRDDNEVSPSIDTSLGISKTRVALINGNWVDEPSELSPFNAGDQVSYRISVTNNGPAVAWNVRVVDDAPAGFTLNKIEDPAEWSHAGPTVEAGDLITLDAASLGVDISSAFVVTYDTDPSIDPDIEQLDNIATASADNSTNKPSDTEPVDPQRVADLEIIKTAAQETVVAGESVGYTLMVRNLGPSDSTAPSIDVKDILPAGFSYETGSARVSVNGGTATAFEPEINDNNLFWGNLTNDVDLPFNGTIEITFTANIAEDVEPQKALVNKAIVHSEDDPNEENDDNDEPVDVETQAEMILTKKVERDVVADWQDDAVKTAGTPIRYQLTVENIGSSAVAATIVDELPEGLTFTGEPVSDEWVCEAPTNNDRTLLCEYENPTLASAELHPVSTATAPYTSTITVTALLDAGVPAGDDLVNTATLTWVDTTTPVADRTVTDTALVTSHNVGDLGLKKFVRDTASGDEWLDAQTAAETGAVVAGASTDYRVIVSNEGPSDAVTPIVVEDALPEGATFEGFVNSPGWEEVVNETTNTVTFTRDAALGGLPYGAQPLEIIYTVGFDEALATGEVLDNTASIADVTTGANNDPNDSNDEDPAHVTVERESFVTIDKAEVSVASGEYRVGESVSFTLDVRSATSSPSYTAGVVVTDTLPAGLEFESIESENDDWSLAVDPPVMNPDGTTDVEMIYAHELAPGQEATQITINTTVTVDIGDLTELTNTACVAIADTNTAPDAQICDDEPINVVPIADLSIEKTVIAPSEDEVTAGESLTWLLQPRNAGPSTSLSTADHLVTVTDTLPEGILSLTTDPSNEHWQATTSNTGGWSQATAGDTITFTYLGDRFVVGDEPDIEITAIIDPAWIGGDAITNVAVISPGITTDPVEPNNEDEVTVTPGDNTMLDIFKNRVVLADNEWVLANSLDPIPDVTAGESVSYRIDVVNEGPAVARGVTVIDAIPEGLSDPTITVLEGNGEWATDSVETCEEGMTDLAGYEANECLTAVLDGPLLTHATSSFIVTFATDPALDLEEALVNWAQARATNVPEEERPEDEDDTSKQALADLSIVKTVEQTEVLAGDTVDYQLVVTNDGPSIARGQVTITDVLPLGMTYVAESAQISIDGETAEAFEPVIDTVQGSERLTWIPVTDEGSLAPGETIVVTLQTVTAVDRLAPEGLRNIAMVASPDDVNPLNNESEATVVVNPVVTLVVTKTAASDFTVGEEGTYVITVTNQGPTADPGPITVTDELPDGLTFHSSSDADVVVDGQLVTWTLAEGLQVNETVELSLTVTVGEAAYPEVTNTVTIDTPSETTPESILSDSAVVKVHEAVPLPSTGGASMGLMILFAGLLMLAGAGTLLVRERKRQQAVTVDND